MNNFSPIRVLFLMKDFEHGGIPRVLANLLECIDTKLVKADVFAANPAGVFGSEMKNCRLLPSSTLLWLLSCNYRHEHGFVKFLAVLAKLLRHSIKKVCNYDLLSWVNRKVARKFSRNYDVVWACSEDIPAQLAQLAEVPRKILWIHSDYNCCYKAVEQVGLPNYLAFEKLVCVSQHAAKALYEIVLANQSIDLRDRIITIYNIVNTAGILHLANEATEDDRFSTGAFCIVSVGRLAWEKQYEAIPGIAAKLLQKGIPFTWYIIGDGAPRMKQIIDNEIQRNGVSKQVVLLGVKSNPYAYISRADLLVLTSRYESYPTVINEAKTLGIPVLSSDFTGADEILSPKDGWICSLEQMADKILQIMQKDSGVTSHRKEKENFKLHNQKVMQDFMALLLHEQ